MLLAFYSLPLFYKCKIVGYVFLVLSFIMGCFIGVPDATFLQTCKTDEVLMMVRIINTLCTVLTILLLSLSEYITLDNSEDYVEVSVNGF
jgi:hypothetical protein